jgi:polysaccharide deacetylase 2 family uncharacterized protein YibQ
VAQKKRGSAKRRVNAKRLRQKKKTTRRISLSILGFLGLSTLLGFAFLLGGGAKKQVAQPERVRPVVQAKAPKVKKTAAPVVVAEEYPEEEEERVGFGLEDLIRKSKRKPEETVAAPSVPAARPHTGTKPQLVIIIDDVSQRRQLETIRKLPYHITPSIFPPSQINVHSNQLVRGLKHYLVHLPLESGSAKMNRFSKTLMVDDGPAVIRKRVEEIRRLFPDARYVNNHTGSVFTSNYGAMYHLFGDLKREGFVFLDSRTTGKSVVKRVAKDYHAPYLARDVFIDNVQSQKAILRQLQKAVRIAQKRGYAIAIGHPHNATFDALRHARGILSKVETVYFDEFYRSRYGH